MPGMLWYKLADVLGRFKCVNLFKKTTKKQIIAKLYNLIHFHGYLFPEQKLIC